MKKHRLHLIALVLTLAFCMQLPASALAASKITLKSGAAAPSTIYALHSYPLKVAGTSVKWYMEIIEKYELAVYNEHG